MYGGTIKSKVHYFKGKEESKQKTEEFLNTHFGKNGHFYYHVVRGKHFSEVKSSRTRKSLAAERTFSENITSEIFMIKKLEDISKEVEKFVTNKVTIPRFGGAESLNVAIASAIMCDNFKRLLHS